MLRGKTVVALLSTLAGVSALWTPGSSVPSSRKANVEGIQEAVLRDLLEDNRPGYSGHSNPLLEDRVVCVSISRTPEPLSNDEGDPNTGLLARLGAAGRPVVPGSSCEMSKTGLVVRETGQRAVLIGVGVPEWISSDFVKVHGAWYLGPLYAAGSRYTVSFAGGRWNVDTVAFTWVS
jgi:hypothetical protein